ncbi:hypothetical protein DFQ28_011679 [Apophysomyces sp. BC1034]|nr:hypothetical protein DFQ30_009783 [Apophysomyces sp. BC1015]KAG0168590.1 hypothetical protein DFQ29_010096 [Apophysomyces sp. BC1021]KAG0184151.1 hypothetical protein DFQ28_011679 [Apophysomyces sp. BC1034]
MDFSAFDLGDANDLFKHNYGMDNANNREDSQHADSSAEFFSFVDYSQAEGNVSRSHTSLQQRQGSYIMPQLTPDGHESAYTGSSILTGHNPEYQMSPLQISAHTSTSSVPTYHTPVKHSLQTTNSVIEEDEEFFTPLVSPAIAPTYQISHAHARNDICFSPLTSPALHPSQQSLEQTDHESVLQRKLALIEHQQQQLRTQMHGGQSANYVSPRPSYHGSPMMQPIKTNGTQRKQSLRQMIVQSSPQIHATVASPVMTSTPVKPMTPHATFSQPPLTTTLPSYMQTTTVIAPATPSLLMKLGGGVVSSSPTLPSTIAQSGSNNSAVDNMMALPAAMLDDLTTTRQKRTTTTTSATASTKRRRISQNKGAFTSPALLPSAHMSPALTMTDPTVAALVSPAALRPQLISSSPRALKPLISPSLRPNGKRLSAIEEETAAAILATKSNYENLKEGKAKSLGIDFSTNIQSGIENRRSAHKAAEQKRRDTLKQSFDSLRTEIIEAMVEEDMAESMEKEDDMRSQKEKEVKQMSKVVLLQHSYEYMLRLKNDNHRKDDKLEKMRHEVQALRAKLGLPKITEEEALEEEKEKEEERVRRLARLKRLANVTTEEQQSSA